MKVDWMSMAVAYVQRNPRASIGLAFEVGMLLGRAVSKRSFNPASAIISLAPGLYDIEKPLRAPVRRRASRAVGKRRS